MKFLLLFLTRVYARLLHLYPIGFKREFLPEMEIVFEDLTQETARAGFVPLLVVFLRELGGLTVGILRELWYEYERKGVNMQPDENKNTVFQRGTKASTRNALLATLPFVLFGLTCVLANLRLVLNPVSVHLIFSMIVLLGLMIGLAFNFPIWVYSYLGWSIVMAWWWMMMPMDTFGRIFAPTSHNQLLGWRSWMILFLAMGIGLLMARSIQPLRQLIRGLGEDWTLLSFMMYAFGAFALLIYDENHHPYLAVFMLGSTLAISLGAWFYLRNANIWKKLSSLLAGFVLAYILSYICYATWDRAVYYGFPETPPQAWYVISISTLVTFLFWLAILFWPTLVGLMQYLLRKSRTA